MKTYVIDKLKESGNEAFNRGQLDKALDFYQKAIKMEEELSKDFKKLALLHSNSAQVYLQQEKYDQAISAASTSLEHDPGFKKSFLRRGIANFELNEHEKATNDLRSFLRISSRTSPNNQQAIIYLREVFTFAKLSDALRKAFIGHYLRRKVIKMPKVITLFGNDTFLVKYLLRSMFLSFKSAQGIKDLLKNGTISSFSQGVYMFALPSWFIVKRMKVDIIKTRLLVTVSKPMLKIIIQVVRPIVSLELDEYLSALELSSLYEFDQVYCASNLLCNDISPIKNFNHVSKVLTGLAYFDGIPSVPMPKLKYLVVSPLLDVNSNFVKDWAKFKWPIKRLDFRNPLSDLSNFANFKGILSHDVTDLNMTSTNSDNRDLQTNFSQQLIERLTILKRCFPNLKNLVVSIEITLGFGFNNGRSLSSSNFLKPYLKTLTTAIDAKKIDWCDNPKVCVEAYSYGEPGSEVLKNVKFIEKTVNECRTEMKELTFIRFNGPSMNKIDIFGGICAYSRIEMEANGVWFDFSFHAM